MKIVNWKEETPSRAVVEFSKKEEDMLKNDIIDLGVGKKLPDYALKKLKSKMQSERNYVECPIHDVDIKECKCKKEDIDEAVKASEEYDKSKMQSKGN